MFKCYHTLTQIILPYWAFRIVPWNPLSATRTFTLCSAINTTADPSRAESPIFRSIH